LEKEEGYSFKPPQKFLDDYEMKLDFGKASKGIVPCKIDLRFPDAKETFLSGSFSIVAPQ